MDNFYQKNYKSIAMSQSLSNLLVHIVFSTKNREPFIDEAIEAELYSYLISIFQTCGSYVYKIGGMEDHIHILCMLPKTLCLSSLLEEIKRKSSKWMKTKGRNYLKFSWQKGFGAFSVSASQIKSVSAYIANQKEHHKKYSFQQEFIKFLKLNNVIYDEKYLWD